jgi:Cu2+-exporting ATPase
MKELMPRHSRQDERPENVNQAAGAAPTAVGLRHRSDVATGHAGHSGHDRHAGHSVAMFRDRFWLSLLLTIPVIFWSHDPQEWFGYEAPAFPGSGSIPAILGTVLFLYGGLVFLRGAAAELADRQPGMMTLISLAGRRP